MVRIAASGSSASRPHSTSASAAPAWITMTLMLCATMSCSSRAMRERSSSTEARATASRSCSSRTLRPDNARRWRPSRATRRPTAQGSATNSGAVSSSLTKPSRDVRNEPANTQPSAYTTAPSDARNGAWAPTEYAPTSTAKTKPMGNSSRYSTACSVPAEKTTTVTVTGVRRRHAKGTVIASPITASTARRARSALAPAAALTPRPASQATAKAPANSGSPSARRRAGIRGGDIRTDHTLRPPPGAARPPCGGSASAARPIHHTPDGRSGRSARAIRGGAGGDRLFVSGGGRPARPFGKDPS